MSVMCIPTTFGFIRNNNFLVDKVCLDSSVSTVELVTLKMIDSLSFWITVCL